jgi:REP element-mobilizing transposase RayT
VFCDDEERQNFLNRLGTMAGTFHVEIHAYALMDTHVHLFVRTHEANLSRFMQRLLSGHTQWFNIRLGTYGHLFQGRYKALVVDKNEYGTDVSRYIHLNPVRTNATKNPTKKEEVVQLRAKLRDYQWSSYRAMIGIAPKEEWLETKDTLSRWGDRLREQQQKYATFVEEGLMAEVTDPAEEAKAQSVLGRDRFMDRIRRILVGRKKYDRESAASRRALTAESVESVKKRVARAYNVRVEDLEKTGRGRGGNEARQVAIWLARERCGGLATMREIGKAMGGMTRSGVSSACRRVSFWLQRNKRVKRIVAKLT